MTEQGGAKRRSVAFKDTGIAMRDWPTWMMACWAVAVCGFAAGALVSDLRSRRIPNWLTASAFAVGIVFHLATSGWSGLGFALGGFLLGFGVMLLLWLIGGGGGGDVKLMGAVGSWVGFSGTAFVFMGGVAVAIVMTFGLLISRWFATGNARLATTGGELANRGASGRRILIPFAVPVCVATWSYVLVRFLAWNHG